MKRLALGIMALVLFCGCDNSTYITNYTGTITVLDNNGNAVKRWDNITFKNEVNGYTSTNSFKSFGLNFYDPESEQFVILSNAVPYIIEYNTQTKVENYSSVAAPANSSSSPAVNGNRAKFIAERENLVNQYDKLEGDLNAYKKELSNLEKDSEEYNKIKTLIKSTKDKMSEIDKTLWNEYHYSI